MTALLKEYSICSIDVEIQRHPAWIGLVSGLHADKMLRWIKTPYQYILRQGETDSAYYVSYVHPDGTVKHQPFVLTTAPEGWYYENGGNGGPYLDSTTIDDVLHLIMHCEKEECVPLIK